MKKLSLVLLVAFIFCSVFLFPVFADNKNSCPAGTDKKPAQAMKCPMQDMNCPMKNKNCTMKGCDMEKIKTCLTHMPPSVTISQWEALSNLCHIKAQIQKFSPTEIKYDNSLIKGNDKKALEKLIEAADYIHQIFLTQVYYKNSELLKELAASNKPEDKALLEYFKINCGPFSRLEGFKTFYGGESRPHGANFYPVDMTKEEFEKWITDHPEDKDAFTSSFTVIKRQGDKLVAVPYPVEYKELLQKASKAMKEAAAYTENPSLKKYLTSRADALLSNDYFQSDCDWMDLKNSTFEVVIGPYEVYEDELFNYKAAYEAFITLNDPAEEKKLEKYASYLGELEKNLPLDENHKNFKRKLTSPMKVVQVIYEGGDARRGVMTLAFNLPNDEKVREAKGSKKVMLKNIIEGKFNKILTPICQKLVDPSQQKYLSFDSFFDQILFHELSHGIGPGTITKDGKETTVAQCLKNYYSSIEEAKADTLGSYNLLYLMKTGRYPKDKKESLMVDYLTGMFRSVRFGIHEAHGKGVILQFNWMMKHGAFSYDKTTGRYKVIVDKFEPALSSLLKELLEIEATGDYARAEKLLKEYVFMPDYMQKSLDSLSDLPVDLRPIFMVSGR